MLSIIRSFTVAASLSIVAGCAVEAAPDASETPSTQRDATTTVQLTVDGETRETFEVPSAMARELASGVAQKQSAGVVGERAIVLVSEGQEYPGFASEATIASFSSELRSVSSPAGTLRVRASYDNTGCGRCAQGSAYYCCICGGGGYVGCVFVSSN
jgi:hypothetical protein